MAEEKKELWLSYLALTTVIFAVCATLSTLKGGGFSTLSVMSQAQASDQWAYYQAKSIKGYVYELQKEKLELELRTIKSKVPRSVVSDYEQKINAYQENILRYEKEKDEIKKKAQDLEAKREEARKHSGAFGLAAMFLQIAILLSSVAALMKKQFPWYIGVLLGVIGILYFFNGFFLFMQ